MGYQSRLPTSNDPPQVSKKNPWLSTNELVDATALLLSGDAERCQGPCKRPIDIRHLDKEKLCPDCRCKKAK